MRNVTALILLALGVASACSSVEPLGDAGGTSGATTDSGAIGQPVADVGAAPGPEDTAVPGADVSDTVLVDAGPPPEDVPPIVDVPVLDVGPDVADVAIVDVSTPPDDTGTTNPCEPHPGAPPALAPRDCLLHFEVTPPFGTAAVWLRSELNDWGAAGEWVLEDGDGDGTFTGAFDPGGAQPGSYGYKLFINGDGQGAGEWILDPSNPLRKLVDGIENSKLYVRDCTVPELHVESLDVDAAGGTVEAVVAVADGDGSAGLLPESAVATVAGKPLPACTFDGASSRFFVSLAGLEPGKHTLRFAVANASGAAEPLFVPIWIEAEPFAWEDAVMYFAFVDRFEDGDTANGVGTSCMESGDPADWKGGDWAGLRQRIESGWFDDLGVTTLWITAPADNPDGCFSGDLPGKQYTSYHGYFPASMTDPEPRFGTLEELRAVVDAAHARGIRVLLDLVANHVHEQHPAYAAHPDWFNPYFQCGFEEKPIECWFQPYLPDIDYKNDEAVEAFTQMAKDWVILSDIDGFRVDAVKHVHMNFLRTLRYELDRLTATSGSSLYLVGETFVGDWGNGTGGEQTIKAYVGPELLEGQFDFPLYWRLLRAFARKEAGLSSLGDYLTESAGYYGQGAVMANFLGNHDVPRFISHANGDIGDVWGNGSKEQGYDAPPGAPAGAEPYERLRAAFSFMFSVSGIPLIYYGDEVGLPGAGDPDNRRVMTFDGLSAEQQATIAHIGALAKARTAHPALRRGATSVLASDDDTLVLLRSLGKDQVIAAFNRGDSPRDVVVQPGDAGTSFVDALSGDSFSASGSSLTIALPPRSARILAQP